MSVPATEREPIGVIGTGYVGLVTAAGFAALGSDVYCVDIDAEKVRGLQEGRIPIWEPGLKELIAEHRERMHFSTHLAPALEHARLLFVAVGTPPTYSGDADLSAVHAVVEAMPASDRHALVMKSTVPVGTGESIERVLAEQRKGFRYVSCPEFLKEGSAVRDFLEPDRVVIGDRADWAGDAVESLYAPLDAPIVRTDVKSAEMVKLASNAFLATKISFINEIANVCEETGADVVEVARGMGLDDRIGPKFLQAGIGFGGSCFAPGETVLARVRGQARLLRFEQLWAEMDGGDAEAVAAGDVEVLSWVPGEAEPEWMAVSLLTRRDYSGEMVEVRTKTGRRVRTTADHPFIVGDGLGDEMLTLKAAADLDETDWLPIALGGPSGFEPELAPVMGAIEGEDVLVRPERREIEALRHVAHRRGAARLHDIRRSGTLRLSEACAADMDLRGAQLGTVSNGDVEPAEPGDRRALLARGRALRCRGPLHARRLAHPLVVPSRTRGASRRRGGQLLAAPWDHGAGRIDRLRRAWSPWPRRDRRPVVEDAARCRPDELHAADSRPRLGADHRAQASAALRPLGGRRVVVAGQRRPERHPRVGHDQRRTGRGRRPAAGRRGPGVLLATRPDREVDQGDALAARQRRRPGRARHVPRPRARPPRGGGRDRPADEADQADRLPPLRRRARRGSGSSMCGASTMRAPCTRWRCPARTPSSRPLAFVYTNVFQKM